MRDLSLYYMLYLRANFRIHVHDVSKNNINTRSYVNGINPISDIITQVNFF